MNQSSLKRTRFHWSQLFNWLKLRWEVTSFSILKYHSHQIRPLPGTLSSLTVNGTGPSSSASSTSLTKVIVSSPPSETNHVYNHLPSHQEQSGLEDAATVNGNGNGEQHVNNPRGGVIGRTPTPPSAPTPVYEKDARWSENDQDNRY